jgi:uncharacterized membrane protein YfcA
MLGIEPEVIGLYLVLGCFAGLMAGLLGIGGGLIIVPALAALFRMQGIQPDIIMHLAIGTSLATIVITSVSSVYAHHKHGAVIWPVFWRLAPGIVIGALIGAWSADALRSGTLQMVFGGFVLLVALQMLSGFRPSSERGIPGVTGLLLSGGMIGAVSAVVGIGGGSLTVPFLSYCNTMMRKAVATSAACGLPIAIAGAAGFVVTGWSHASLPVFAYGYVYAPAAVAIVMTSVLFAPVGAHLAHRLPTAALKKFFALFLLLVGLKLLLV